MFGTHKETCAQKSGSSVLRHRAQLPLRAPVQWKLLSPQNPLFGTRLFVCAKKWVLGARQVPKQAQRALYRLTAENGVLAIKYARYTVLYVAVRSHKTLKSGIWETTPHADPRLTSL